MYQITGTVVLLADFIWSHFFWELLNWTLVSLNKEYFDILSVVSVRLPRPFMHSQNVLIRRLQKVFRIMEDEKYLEFGKKKTKWWKTNW